MSYRPGVIQNGAPPSSVRALIAHRQHLVRRHETDRGRQRRERKCLHEELTDDSRAARTERRTQGDFSLRVAVLA